MHALRTALHFKHRTCSHCGLMLLHEHEQQLSNNFHDVDIQDAKEHGNPKTQ